MKYSVLIIDDSQTEINTIWESFFKLIPNLTDTYDISAVTNVNLSDINLFSYDIYLIDIKIGEYGNGMELANYINENNREAIIMMCTNYDNLVFEAFTINIYFFIRKSNLSCDLYNGFLKFEKLKKEMQTVTVKHSNSFNRFNKKDIFYIESVHNQLIVYLSNGKNISFYDTMKHFLQTINCEYIVQISRSIAVNIHSVSKISGIKLVMNNNKYFFASKRRIKEIKSVFWKANG